MDNTLNHECAVCGTKYHHCDSCGKIQSFTPWRIICDTAQHYQVFLTIKDYDSKIISKDEAVDELNRIGVEKVNIGDYKESIQAIMKEIFSVKETKTIKTTEPISKN
jgi:hypothetical protein